MTLNSTFDPLKQTISGYAAGTYGLLEKLGMEMVAVSFFFIARKFVKYEKQRGIEQIKVHWSVAGYRRDRVLAARYF